MLHKQLITLRHPCVAVKTADCKTRLRFITVNWHINLSLTDFNHPIREDDCSFVVALLMFAVFGDKRIERNMKKQKTNKLVPDVPIDFSPPYIFDGK